MKSYLLVRYTAKRILISLFVLAGISISAFWMSYLLPSDPVTSRFPFATADQVEEIRRQMGLDEPLLVQYWRYLQSVFQGEFGASYNTGNPVSLDLKTRIPATLELAVFAIILGIAVGIPTGIIAAVRRHSPTDHLARIFSIATQSLPAFWLGFVLIYFLFYKLHWVPAPVGRLPISFSPPEHVTGFLVVDSLLEGDWKLAAASLKQMLLPGIVLGMGLIAPIARITRASMSETLQEDYIVFSRAVGLPERKIVLNDALRGSSVAIVTAIGYLLGNVILSGAAIVETVFSWPGLGQYVVIAITTSDMAPITTSILVIASAIAIINLVVDVSYAFIDPRIRDGLLAA